MLLMIYGMLLVFYSVSVLAGSAIEQPVLGHTLCLRIA